MGDTKKEETEENELTEEEKRRKNIVSGVGGILAMLPTIAGAIPSLKKSGQKGALEAMQRGQGAGATAARQAGAAAGRATAGNMGGRGSSGLVREGLRSAERQSAEGVRQAAIVGAQEGQRGTQLLLENERLRRGAGLQLGAGIGGAAASAIATGLAGRDQGEASKVGGEEVGGALATGQGIADTTSGAWMDRGQDKTPMGSVFGTAGGRAFGEQPSLGVNTTLAAPTEQPAIPNAPQTQLQQPELGAQQPSEGFALQTMVNPQVGLDQAKMGYVESVARRPSERPRLNTRSRGGSDSLYFQQELARYEQYLAEQADIGAIDPAIVPDLIMQFVADRGGI
ncbi:MAG: hypothetical protein KJP27_06780 [Altererythrobacter sp.]|nr:hypothetical protein [Altererythrobacter sp.]